MALGFIMIMFVGMSVIGVLGLLFMYLLKEGRAKKIVFYLMALWGVAISAIGATSLPNNFIASRTVALILGALSVAGVVVYAAEKKKNMAYALILISVAAGTIKLFLAI